MQTSAFPISSNQYFERLREAPVLAMPTAVLFVVSLGGIGTTWYLALNDLIPLWVGAIANGLLTYLLFSVIHDASHKSLSRIRWLNESIGAIGLFAANRGINIANMHLGRRESRGDAISLLEIDAPINQKDLEALRAINHIHDAQYLHFDPLML